jgi:hypothetical protein
MTPRLLRRPALIAAIAALFIVMPFVYPAGPGHVETVPTPPTGTLMASAATKK